MTSVSPIGLTAAGLRRGLFLALRARHRSRAGAKSGREITKKTTFLSVAHQLSYTNVFENENEPERGGGILRGKF